MPRYLLLIFLLACGIPGCISPEKAQDLSALRAPVVLIQSDLESGAGFLVGERGNTLYFLTAAHVIFDPQEMSPGKMPKNTSNGSTKTLAIPTGCPLRQNGSMLRGEAALSAANSQEPTMNNPSTNTPIFVTRIVSSPGRRSLRMMDMPILPPSNPTKPMRSAFTT